MGDLEPITRNEKLWSGEDLTPVTRKEMYIKHLYDETQVIPEYPVTREEMFILKAGEELHDVTIEQLTATENKTYSEEGVAYSPVIVNVPQTTLTTLDVTENGTYTAPTGTAYSEVDVDVPLPSNAYLLKEIEDVEIASFNDGSDLPMPKLEVAIEPQQDLHGYDSSWVGGAGRNLFSVGSRVDGTIADVRYTSDDEYIYLNGTKQGSGYADLSSSSNITLDSGTYYIRAFVISGTASNTVELYPYDGTNNLTGNVINNERTFTLSESKTFRFRFAIWTDGTVLNNYKIGIVISKTANIDKFYPYSNICPISGWDEVNVGVSGVNIWDEETRNGYYNTDGSFTSYSSNIANKNSIFVKSGVTYRFECLSANFGRICWYDKDKMFISTQVVQNRNISITAPSNACWLNFDMVGAYGTTYNNDISINYPSTDTSYHAYNGHTYTIDLNGTRYGGKVDLVSGVMTVTHGYADLNNTNNWQLYNGGNNDMYYLDGVVNDISISEESLAHVICSKYPYSNDAFVKDAFRINTGKRLYIGDTRFVNDLSGFKESLTNGVQLVYELATPLTIQLTPTVVKSLRGKNNVYADTGNVLDLSYLAKEE